MNVRHVLVLSSILASVLTVPPATAQGTAAQTAKAAVADNADKGTGVHTAAALSCMLFPFLPGCSGFPYPGPHR